MRTMALLADRKYDEVDALLAGTANQLFAAAKEDMDKRHHAGRCLIVRVGFWSNPVVLSLIGLKHL